MKRILMLTTALIVALAPAAGIAGNHKSKGCPPGLAKKNPPCVPPGQAKKYGYDRGDIVRRGDYVIIERPSRYGLDPDETYYRVGDQVLRVNRETREVLDLIGAIGAVLD